jgi:hypothetical protein
MPSGRIRDVFPKEQCQDSKIKYISVIILYFYHNLFLCVTYAVLKLLLFLRQFPSVLLCAYVRAISVTGRLATDSALQ